MERENGFYWIDSTDTTGTYREVYEYYNGDWYSCGRKINGRRVSNVNEKKLIETAG